MFRVCSREHTRGGTAGAGVKPTGRCSQTPCQPLCQVRERAMQYWIGNAVPLFVAKLLAKLMVFMNTSMTYRMVNSNIKRHRKDARGNTVTVPGLGVYSLTPLGVVGLGVKYILTEHTDSEQDLQPKTPVQTTRHACPHHPEYEGRLTAPNICQGALHDRFDHNTRRPSKIFSHISGRQHTHPPHPHVLNRASVVSAPGMT